jgi:hypothetical protein
MGMNPLAFLGMGMNPNMSGMGNMQQHMNMNPLSALSQMSNLPNMSGMSGMSGLPNMNQLNQFGGNMGGFDGKCYLNLDKDKLASLLNQNKNESPKMPDMSNSNLTPQQSNEQLFGNMMNQSMMNQQQPNQEQVLQFLMSQQSNMGGLNIGNLLRMQQMKSKVINNFSGK